MLAALTLGQVDTLRQIDIGQMAWVDGQFDTLGQMAWADGLFDTLGQMAWADGLAYRYTWADIGE